MGKTSGYVTRVLFAVPEDILPELRKPLRKREDFHVITPAITDGEELLQSVRKIRPDALVLDVTLPGLDKVGLLTALSSKRLRPYVVAIAPFYKPHLLDLQTYPAVRGVLPHVLALSPLLRVVLAAIAEGGTYFFNTPPADRSDLKLSSEETVLMALIAAGLGPLDVAKVLEHSRHTAYTNESLLRKKLGVQYNEQVILMAIGRGLAGVLTQPRHRAKESA